jgi:hypothetical protein
MNAQQLQSESPLPMASVAPEPDIGDETESVEAAGLKWFCSRYTTMFCTRSTDSSIDELIEMLSHTKETLKISSFDQYRVLENVKSILQHSRIRMQISHVGPFVKYFRFLAFIDSILIIVAAIIASIFGNLTLSTYLILVTYGGFFVVTVGNTASGHGALMQAKSVTSLMQTFLRASGTDGQPEHIDYWKMNDDREQRRFFLYNAESVLGIQQTIFDFRRMVLTQSASFSAILYSVVSTATSQTTLLGIIWLIAIVALGLRSVEFIVLYDMPDLLVFNSYIYKARVWLTESSIAFVSSSLNSTPTS